MPNENVRVLKLPKPSIDMHIAGAQRQITVRYMLNPNFPPTDDNLVTFDCDNLNYYWPAHPNMNISSFVSPTPVGYSCVQHDTGKCKQFLAYQLVDVTYNWGFEEMVKTETEKARLLMQKAAEAHGKNAEENPQDTLWPAQTVTHPQSSGIEIT